MHHSYCSYSTLASSPILPRLVLHKHPLPELPTNPLMPKQPFHQTKHCPLHQHHQLHLLTLLPAPLLHYSLYQLLYQIRPHLLPRNTDSVSLLKKTSPLPIAIPPCCRTYGKLNWACSPDQSSVLKNPPVNRDRPSLNLLPNLDHEQNPLSQSLWRSLRGTRESDCLNDLDFRYLCEDPVLVDLSFHYENFE